MTKTTTKRWWLLGSTLLLAVACGGQLGGSPEDETDGTRAEETAYLKWWNSALTYQSVDYGWHDTDLAVSSGTPVQLRHASKLIAHGVYGWGFMPTFVDQVTGHEFRFLHLKPQYQYATHVGQVYPAGAIVGISGGDTKDTGLGVYSTGAHLCVQTIVPYRTAFPAGPEGGAGSSGGGSSSGSGASCHSATLNRTVGAGTCVQSAADANWYTCENGNWVAGEHNCGASYPFCHSSTLGKYVPARTCVESKYDRVWYQCDSPGWVTPVNNGAGPLGTCSSMHAL